MGEKDPDSLIQKHGVDRFLEILGNANDIFTFALKQWAADINQLSGRDKSERVDRFVDLLSAVNDPVVRNDAAQRIADSLRLEFETVWSRVRGKAQPANAERHVSAPASSGEKTMLMAAIQGRLPEGTIARLKDDYFADPACKTLFSIIKTDLTAGNPIDFGEVQTHLRGEAELTLLSELTLSEDVDERVVQGIDEYLRPMERQAIERRKLEIQREVAEAAKRGDEEKIEE